MNFYLEVNSYVIARILDLLPRLLVENGGEAMESQSSSWGKPEAVIQKELVVYLEEDSSLYGEIWRNTKQGISDEEIQKSRGASTPNFIWNYRRYTQALLEGDLPKSPSMLRETGVLFRKILRSNSLSISTKSFLEDGLIEIESRINNRSLQAVEESEALRSSQILETKNAVGIYVYSLMHYLRYPYEPVSGRTLVKVGRSDRDVIQRFREQTRTTALPEEPVLLRIYQQKDSSTQLAILEKEFHSLLEAADHDRSAARTGGTEWFLTSLKFLDKIADTLNLTITINDKIEE